jgi:hypothetical protein
MPLKPSMAKYSRKPDYANSRVFRRSGSAKKKEERNHCQSPLDESNLTAIRSSQGMSQPGPPWFLDFG